LLRAIASGTSSTDDISPDPSHVNLRSAPALFDASSAVVYPNFISEEEGESFIKEASKRMKRRRFEQGHWDSVIVGYREVEMMIQDDATSRGAPLPNAESDDSLFVNAIQRTRRHLEAHHFPKNPTSVKWIPCHAIDLLADGRLDAHVDSVKFSGNIVAGLSLLSDSVMRLKPCSDEWLSENSEEGNSEPEAPQGHVDLYLPKKSLYVLSGMSRFTYTHELLASGSTFEFTSESEGINANTIAVDRGRRLSIIFRDELQKISRG
jgi:alkylated DNA repair protein alkB family protein 7